MEPRTKTTETLQPIVIELHTDQRSALLVDALALRYAHGEGVDEAYAALRRFDALMKCEMRWGQGTTITTRLSVEGTEAVAQHSPTLAPYFRKLLEEHHETIEADREARVLDDLRAGRHHRAPLRSTRGFHFER